MGLKPNQPACELHSEAVARQLGQDAFERAKEQATEVVAWEKVRREKDNLSEIVSLRARYDCLYRSRAELKETLRFAPSGDPTNFQRRRWYCGAFALTLVIAGIFFAHLALAPFGLGWEAWILCLGIAWVTAFWTERTLEKISCEALMQTMCFAALLASLGGLLLMALLRGDILTLYLRTAGEMPEPEVANAFYSHAAWKLQLLMALLAIAMELGSGMALFEAGKIDLSGFQRARQAKKELADVEREMVAVIGRVTHLENDHLINEAEFWRNFYLGLLERIKRHGLLPLILFACLTSLAPNSSAQIFANAGATEVAETDFVIALDFTQSVVEKGYDGKTDFEKNVDSACELVEQLPPSSRVFVFAITDRSFAQPYLLIQRDIPRDKGPLQFQDRIALAKTRAATELRKKALFSSRSIVHTDILGALNFTGDLLKQSSRRKVLILFSDMRQSTNELDVERLKMIPLMQTLASVERLGLMAQLQGVEVYALGVDGAGKSVSFWKSLRDFWEAYFHKAGAQLKAYSASRNLPELSVEKR